MSDNKEQHEKSDSFEEYVRRVADEVFQPLMDELGIVSNSYEGAALYNAWTKEWFMEGMILHPLEPIILLSDRFEQAKEFEIDARFEVLRVNEDTALMDIVPLTEPTIWFRVETRHFTIVG